jgi:NADH:ubiquinone oxidoreductase subunit D
MARSTGLKRDLRMMRLETYANYYHLCFRAYTGQNGDSYDRYLIRMNEMAESLCIINQVIFKLINKKKKFSTKPLAIVNQLNLRLLNKKIYNNEYNSMEKLIQHFKY